jgi:predicted GH43/DUF377 family glycosyl hydrolase
MPEREVVYKKMVAPVLEEAQAQGRVDLVIGIPLLGDDVGKAEMLAKVVRSGLSLYYPGTSSLIVCISKAPHFAEKSKKILRVCEDCEEAGYYWHVHWADVTVQQRGWMFRALMDTAKTVGADLIILEPALFAPNTSEVVNGIGPEWIRLLYQPIVAEEADMAVPRFTLSLHGNSLADHLVYPLLGALFSTEMRSSLATGGAISNHLLNDLLDDSRGWISPVYEYGIDAHLLVSALANGASLAEVYMGHKPLVSLPVGMDYLVKQTVHVLFEYLCKASQQWINRPAAIRSAWQYGMRQNAFGNEMNIEHRTYLTKFKRGFARYYEVLWARIFPEDVLDQIREAAETADENFAFSEILWSKAVYYSLIAYSFGTQEAREDIAAGLVPLYNGRIAGFYLEIARHEDCVDNAVIQAEICPVMARNLLDSQVDAFILSKQNFIEAWQARKESQQPYLPQLAYWEYIPGAPILLPLMVKKPDGHSDHVSSIYEKLLKETKQEFEGFLQEHLGIRFDAGTALIGEEVRRMMVKFEVFLDTFLLPGDIFQIDGVRQFTAAIFTLAGQKSSFSMRQEFAERMLRDYPPRNLITILGFADMDAMFKKYSPLDALALSVWSEESKYISRNNNYMLQNMRPEDFELTPIRPLVVDQKDFPEFSAMKDAPSLNHLTGRIVVGNIRHGAGGDYPKIRLFTTILKRIIDAERFGGFWRTFAKSHRDFPRLVLNSIEGHWGVSTFSARSIFENDQQRLLKEALQQIHDQLADAAQLGTRNASEDILKKVIDGYFLGMTLPDGQFISTSIWSWASYSFKGGKGMPTPLSLMVERRAFSSELFYRCAEKVDVSPEEIDERIVELIGDGMESEDLSVTYLGAPSDGERIVIRQKMGNEQHPAGSLQRSLYNPILAPISTHPWETKYVLNAGVIRLDGRIFILYRAYGDDNISRVGLAITKDGVIIDERLPEPIFEPATDYERGGCEDVRLVKFEGRIYMLYTAYDGVLPQIAIASISPEDMAALRFDKWERHGLVFPGTNNKDAVLFPERFNGKVALYHRVNPSIWVTYADEVARTPWPRENHHIVMGTRSGMMWDAVKIGAGAQPIKTKYGWLHIYHGVDYSFVYRLGIFISALDDPAKLTYRSPNPILEPKASYEIGVSGTDWVPNVVFTCGAVPVKDKEMLDDDDEILVYYGCADSNIGVASATVAALIPESVRMKAVT